MCLAAESFGDQGYSTPHAFPAKGNLHLCEDVDKFRELDKNVFLSEVVGRALWTEIKSGAALKDPSMLANFALLAHVDLKSLLFTYWFAFPTFKASIEATKVACESILSKSQLDYVCSNVKNLGFFVVVPAATASGDEATIHPLHELESLKQHKNFVLGFSDPSGLSNHPGWPLRNLIIAVAAYYNISEATVIAFRGPNSIAFQYKTDVTNQTEMPTCVGWEMNSKGKPGSRKLNLNATLNPEKLAEQAADLNLKLMRWRFLPDLDTTLLGNTRVLLVGSGTLGCNVARCLMSWGVRKIDFVDQGHVSYSNPTRQWLFEFEHCQNREHKATAAAKQMRKIFPAMEANGHDLGIPMPGHPISEANIDSCKQAVATLEQLIESADAVFLLTDTRESRWLPSVIAAAKRKIVLNVALGFDSYLVIRHGVLPPASTAAAATDLPNPDYGCYFCNDIVAPVDSTRHRAMDQQCTVTRPGLSPIASAIAVEMLVSILHHPQRPYIPASPPTQVGTHVDNVFGIIPHTIRGYITYFSNVVLTGHSFDRCIACSSKVTTSYQQQGFDFLLKCFNQPSYLEELTGITELTKNIPMDWEDDDDDF